MRATLTLSMLLAVAVGCNLPNRPAWDGQESGGGGVPLVVVHVERQWDGAERVADGVASRARGREIYMLTTEPGDWRAATLVPSIRPSEIIVAPGGEWEGLAAPGGAVEFCGGYLRGCLANAAGAVVRRSPGVTIVLPMRDVYHGAHRTLEEEFRDNWRGDVGAFLRYMVEEVAPGFGFARPAAGLVGGMLLLRESY